MIYKEEHKNMYLGKKALVGDYFKFSYFNTINVLKFLGFEVTLEKAYYNMKDRIQNKEPFDIIFSNNIYQVGKSGPDLVKFAKSIEGFNIPIIVHTISKNTHNIFIEHHRFDGYIEKPLITDKVVSVIKDLI